MRLLPSTTGPIFENHSSHSMHVAVGVRNDGDRPVIISPGGSARIRVETAQTRFAAFTVPAEAALHASPEGGGPPLQLQIGVLIVGPAV
jgi:hypothetical protein